MWMKKKYFYMNYDVWFDLWYLTNYLRENFEEVIYYKIFFKDTPHEWNSEIIYLKNGLETEKNIVYKSTSKNPIIIIFSYLVYFNTMRKIIKWSSKKDFIFISSNPIFNFFAIILWLNNIYIVWDIMRTSIKWFVNNFFSRIIQLIIKIVLKNSFKIWFISQSLFNYFSKLNLKKYYIWTLPIKKNVLKFDSEFKNTIVYIWVFDDSKWLDLILKAANVLIDYRFILIWWSLSVENTNVEIYDAIIDQEKLEKLLCKEEFIWIAPYNPKFLNNTQYLWDPTKIKQYLSYGIPVITTNIVEFSNQIDTFKCWLSINYDIEEFINSIIKISTNYNYYKNNVFNLLDKFDYSLVYGDFFKKL